MKELTEREKLLVELVHLLAYGDKVEFGLTLEETLQFLQKPLVRYKGKNCLDILSDGLLREIKDHLEDRRR